MDPRALFESEDLSWLEKPDRDVESNWVERKRWIEARDLAEQVSAFANGQPPGGLIVVGVTTEGKIVGVDDKSPDDLIRRLGDNLEGRLGKDWEYRFVQAADKSQVLLIYAPCS